MGGRLLSSLKGRGHPGRTGALLLMGEIPLMAEETIFTSAHASHPASHAHEAAAKWVVVEAWEGGAGLKPAPPTGRDRVWHPSWAILGCCCLASLSRAVTYLGAFPGEQVSRPPLELPGCVAQR